MRSGYLFAIFLIALILSCNRIFPDEINEKVVFQRFDRELFGIRNNTFPEAIDSLYEKYSDFLEVFSYHIISIGLPAEKTYRDYLTLFINDPLTREVYTETQKVFPDMKNEEEIISKAFNRYKYHFPENKIPEIVTFVSGFNNPCFTVGEYIGIGLDMYLGSSSKFYDRLQIPQYLKTNMRREKIPSDLIYVWSSDIFPYHDSVNNLLSHMIHQGQLMYFLEALLPKESDELLIGFTKEQLRWCNNNEEMMWIYLIENKLLFSEDQMNIRKIMGPAPFINFFTKESPGKSGIWIGWQIIKEFAKHNPKLSLKQIMEENDYEKILRLSKYSP